MDYQDKDKLTPLLLASNEGHFLLTKWLVVNGVDIYRKDKHGGSALDAALGNGHSDIVNVLIESQNIINHGGDVDNIANLE